MAGAGVNEKMPDQCVQAFVYTTQASHYSCSAKANGHLVIKEAMGIAIVLLEVCLLHPPAETVYLCIAHTAAIELRKGVIINSKRFGLTIS